MGCTEQYWAVHCPGPGPGDPGGLNHQIIEESWDVTPVTEEKEEEESEKNSILVDQKPQKQTMEV